MSTQSVIPAHYDLDFILRKMNEAGVVNHYGHGESNGDTIIVYRAEDFEKVQGVLDAYEVQYADEVLRPQMMAQLTTLRREKQKSFNFEGQQIMSDPESISSMTAAVVLMDTNPDSPITRRWKVGPGPADWMTLDRTALVALGTAAADHVQACFNVEEAKLALLFDAANVDDLLEIDLECDWPS